MFVFDCSMLVCLRARDKMGYADANEKGVQLLILPSPINLHGNDLSIEQFFNMFKYVKLALLQKCTVATGHFFLKSRALVGPSLQWLVVTGTPNISGSKHSSNRHC
jgi:hypothetical protein